MDIRIFARTPPQSTGGFVPLLRKVSVGHGRDAFEREAERMEARAEKGSDEACACGGSCGGCTTKVQRMPAGEAATAVAPPAVDHVLAASGSPLDDSVRTSFEPRFQFDFSEVRIHADARAAAAAESVNARAFTVGKHIAFGAGEYRPATSEGRRLLAHELTHVVQQSGGTSRVDRKSKESVVPQICGGAWSCSTACEKPDAGRDGNGAAASSWSLQVHVDIEAESAAAVTSDVGHTYIELSDSSGRGYTFGFYPAKPGVASPFTNEEVDGCVVHPDTTHKTCVDFTKHFSLTKAQFDAALAYASSTCKSPPKYHLVSRNCTTFAANIAASAGQSLPPVRGSLAGGMYSADNPNTLYEGLVKQQGPTHGLMSDTEIRDALAAASAESIKNMSSLEKARVIIRLFVGWVSDEDITAIESVWNNRTSAETAMLKKLIEKNIPDLNSIGQRTRLRLMLLK